MVIALVTSDADGLKSSPFVHNISLHTTDGGVQSPPPPPPFRGGGPFAVAKVVVTSVISIADGLKNLNKHKLQREVEDLAKILNSENCALEKTRSRHSIKIHYKKVL